MRWRWQEDKSPGTPWANMARDETLLEEMIGDAASLPIVRVYHWDRPSVSFGRLQDAGPVALAFPGLPAIRRPTGGLAVRHGDDVTISVVARDEQMPPTESRGVLASYRLIVGTVIEAFGQVGVSASLAGTERADLRTDLSPVDCFAHAARCDVIARGGEQKLAGCAQRRKQRVVLQQMSVPLSRQWDERQFVEALKQSFMRRMGVSGWLLVDTSPSV